MRTLSSTLFVLLAASGCKEVTTFTDAGGDDDSTADGATVDAPATGQVTVITRTRRYDADALRPDVPVIAVGVDGTLRDQAVTDADGQAVLDVVGGDSVTAIYPPNVNNEITLVTTVAVEPGDTLTYGAYYLPQDETPTGTLAVSWQPVSGISYWYVFTDCAPMYAGAATTVTVTRYARCGDDVTDVVLVGYDTMGFPSQVATQSNVAWTSGAVVFSATQTTPQLTVRASGIPAEVSYFSVNAYGRVGPTIIYGPYAYASPVIDGMFSATAGWVAGPGQPYADWYANSRNPNTGNQNGWLALMPTTTELAFVDPPLLPWVNEPIANAGAREVTWIQTDGAPYDVAMLELSYSAQQPGVVPGLPIYSYHWRIILPPGVTSLDFPELPTELAQHYPTVDQSIYTSLKLLEAPDLDGYRAARNAPEWDIDCYNCTRPAPAGAIYSMYGGGD